MNTVMSGDIAVAATWGGTLPTATDDAVLAHACTLATGLTFRAKSLDLNGNTLTPTGESIIILYGVGNVAGTGILTGAETLITTGCVGTVGLLIQGSVTTGTGQAASIQGKVHITGDCTSGDSGCATNGIEVSVGGYLACDGTITGVAGSGEDGSYIGISVSGTIIGKCIGHGGADTGVAGDGISSIGTIIGSCTGYGGDGTTTGGNGLRFEGPTAGVLMGTGGIGGTTGGRGIWVTTSLITAEYDGDSSCDGLGGNATAGTGGVGLQVSSSGILYAPYGCGGTGGTGITGGVGCLCSGLSITALNIVGNGGAGTTNGGTGLAISGSLTVLTGEISGRGGDGSTNGGKGISLTGGTINLIGYFQALKGTGGTTTQNLFLSGSTYIKSVAPPAIIDIRRGVPRYLPAASDADFPSVAGEVGNLDTDYGWGLIM